MLNSTNYNPDVLSCIANLSSDEVFTPPQLANQIMDLLPKEIWSDKNVRFLDPFCKSGVFLREIARRLDSGLANTIPDKQTRINHIFKNQIFGLAITELTSLLSRRSVCTAPRRLTGNIPSVRRSLTRRVTFALSGLSIPGNMDTVPSAEQASENMIGFANWKPMPISLSTPKNRRNYLK